MPSVTSKCCRNNFFCIFKRGTGSKMPAKIRNFIIYFGILKRLLPYLFLFTASLLKSQFNYGHQMDFGKNRIQYQSFVWTYLDYDRYRVYSYQGGAEIAKYVAVSITRQLEIMEHRVDFQLEDKLNILVYNNQDDFKQSNLGLSSNEQTNLGGVTRIIADKVSIFFNGSHADLDLQIRAVIAELLVNKFLYGGNAGQVVRNSTLVNIPPWFTAGLVKYLSEGWSSEHDNLLYDDIKSNNFRSFNRLSGKDGARIGHALWYYIVSTFGEGVISNMLYMTRVSRSPDKAMQYTLGLSLSNLIYDFTESHQRKLYMFRDSLRNSPINNNSVLKRYKPFRHYYQPKINADGTKLIYARTELNQLRVYLRDLESGKEKRLLRMGPKVEQLEDYSYPLLAWHPNGKIVSMVYERKNQLLLHTYDLESGDVVKRNVPLFEKVTSMSYSPDGKKLAMSAVKRGKGQSDIFVFGVNSSAVEQITNDIWDDQQPVFTRGSKQLVFASNRLQDTLRISDDANYAARFNRNMDLFMAPYPLTTKVLVKVTNTPDVNELNPQTYGKDYVSFLSDENGIYNRHLARYDSSIAFVDTTEHYRYYYNSKVVSNWDRNILEQSISSDQSKVAELIRANGRDMLLVTALPKLTELDKSPVKTWERTYVSPAVTDPDSYRLNKQEQAIPIRSGDQAKGRDIDNYKFENEKSTATISSTAQPGGDSLRKKTTVQGLKFPLQKNYYTSFYTDQVVTQFDNSFFANNYQVFSGNGQPIYLNPGFNFVTKVAISDLFEDQRLVGGYRINPNLDNEFMLSWEQRKNLFDHQVVLDRQTFQDATVADASGRSYPARINTSTLRYSVKYPFNPAAALRLSALYRNDRKMPRAISDVPLSLKPQFENLGGVRLEYIYDNTRKVMLNVLNGFRFKVWTEYWRFSGSMTRELLTSGFDARHYQKIHRQITWCNRLAGGNSQGSDRLIFFLGGVDNWQFPQFNQQVNIVRPEQYGFQTLATNLRGFQQNIRNGNNFLVYNSELRIPVVRYLLDHPVASDFFNNLQLIGFTDLGMAWTGWNPLSDENTQNTKIYNYNDASGQGGTGIVVTVIDNKNPLVGGVGFGLRTRLLGYFVRLDFGWGIDNRKVTNKTTALSFTTDF